MSKPRFPWNIVSGFEVTSRADGTMLVEPNYIEPHDPEKGGGPGVMTRVKLAMWCLDRISKRRTRQPE